MLYCQVLLKNYWPDFQEGWLAEHAVSEEDKLAAENAKAGVEDRPEDPMQGLEGLDVAGPKPEWTV